MPPKSIEKRRDARMHARVKAAKNQRIRASRAEVLAGRRGTRVQGDKECIEGEIERASNVTRRNRVQESVDRHHSMQQLISKARSKQDKSNARLARFSLRQKQQRDLDAFHEAIDAPLLFICGSCGGLSNPRQMRVVAYDPEAVFFNPLCVKDADDVLHCHVVQEALVASVGIMGVTQQMPLCKQCFTSLKRSQAPKFSFASGFRLASVPAELAVLNVMEQKMIGLGVCFTTCFNLQHGGQEFTKGNAINYWNRAHDIVKTLPRPLSKCGIVRMKTPNEKEGLKYYNIRPHLVRAALLWLKSNNPLYSAIEISESELAALRETLLDNDIPTIEIEEDDDVSQGRVPSDSGVASQDMEIDTVLVDSDGDSQAMEIDTVPVNPGRASQDLNIDTVRVEVTPVLLDSSGLSEEARDPGAAYAHVEGCTEVSEHETLNRSAVNPLEGNVGSSVLHDNFPGVIETFDLDGQEGDDRTEVDRVLESLRGDVDCHSHPVSDMPHLQNPIDEYTTKMLMQNCFPVLFPDGCGGFHPLEGVENRQHEYKLAEYCAHLMTWHDRRFVIHRNFKFFCLNLIQRRQIDGLVRRIPERGRSFISGMDGSDCTEVHVDTLRKIRSEKELDETGRKLLKELKPYFTSVRGSGLYWSRVRDELMALIGNHVLPTPWPTFFFTLSAADTIWPDFFRACDPTLTLEAAGRLSAKERQRYLNENPDVASRHFLRRFSAFFSEILNGSAAPLGEITDFFWRVEFQKRGSPHIHGLLWIKDAPDVLSLAETEDGRETLAAFLDQHISVMRRTQDEIDNCACGQCKSAVGREVNILAQRGPQQDMDSIASRCDVDRIVAHVQEHVCFPGASCREKMGECRFGFPKALEVETRVESENAADGTPSLKLYPRRNMPSTNNYCPAMIRAWRANMDIQLIGNAYGAAEYTAAYVSKAEPDTVRFRKAIGAAVGRCNPEAPYYTILKKVANATLAVREVSAQEAYFILMRDMPLYAKSRNLVRVKCQRHSERYYRVDGRDPEDDCTSLVENDATENVRLEAIEAAYMARPDQEPFTNMSYRSFVENYEAVAQGPKERQRLKRWERVDGRGFIKARTTPQAVCLTPKMVPDDANPAFCFAELFMEVPWRNLSELPSTDAECTDAFLSFRERSASGIFCKQLQARFDRQKNLDMLSNAHKSAQFALAAPEWVFTRANIDAADEEDLVFGNPHEEASLAEFDGRESSVYTAADVTRAKTFVPNVLRPFLQAKKEKQKSDGRNEHSDAVGCVEWSGYMYPIDQDSNMNDEQWIPFALCMEQSRLRLAAQQTNMRCHPMRMVLNGEGGSGKSWLIRHIVKDVHEVFQDLNVSVRRSRRVLLMAHQGTAAFNIKGSTLCSSLHLPSQGGKKTFSARYESILATRSGPAQLKRMQEEYRDVHLVIIDEHSVISCAMLHWIDQRMREIWPAFREEPFGGRDIIFAGDSGQLSPVIPSALSVALRRLTDATQRRGRAIWEEMEFVCTLRSQNRGKTDPEYFDALRRLREKKVTQDDVALFNTRCFSNCEQPEWMREAQHIAYRNVDVDAANQQCIRHGRDKILIVRASHEVHPRSLRDNRAIPEATGLLLLDDATIPNKKRDKVIRANLELARGVPVTLSYNIEQSAGLCNGSRGTVYDFMFEPGSKIPIVLVQMVDKYLGPSFLEDVPNVVPIIPKTVSWLPRRHSDLKITRTGLPLRLAYAMTVHKVQGLTCKKVVFYSEHIPSSAFAYVALSRVVNRADIVLTAPVDLKTLGASEAEKEAFDEESMRIKVKTDQCRLDAEPSIMRMQALARAHNAAFLPR